MDEIEVTGKSVEEIIERAAMLLNCKPEYLEYTVLKDERRNGTRNITCKIWKREYKTGLPGTVTPSDEELDNFEENPVQELSPVAARAKAVLQELVRHICRGGKVQVRERREAIELDIVGEESAVIIGRHGQTLEALQHILVKILTSRGQDLDKMLVIDAEGYRQRRRELLEKMARKMKKEALASGKPIFVEPMSPFERRIIHLTLDKDRDVYTKSVGLGPNRQVVIAPRSVPEEVIDRQAAQESE